MYGDTGYLNQIIPFLPKLFLVTGFCHRSRNCTWPESSFKNAWHIESWEARLILDFPRGPDERTRGTLVPPCPWGHVTRLIRDNASGGFRFWLLGIYLLHIGCDDQSLGSCVCGILCSLCQHCKIYLTVGFGHFPPENGICSAVLLNKLICQAQDKVCSRPPDPRFYLLYLCLLYLSHPLPPLFHVNITTNTKWCLWLELYWMYRLSLKNMISCNY